MSKQAAKLIYDGDCPFCSAYVRMLRLRENIELELIDARSDPEIVAAANRAGFDLDEGFLLEMAHQHYYGQEAIHALALMSSRVGLLNRLSAAIFARPALARILYPVLRFFRNLTLRLLGREKLAANFD